MSSRLITAGSQPASRSELALWEIPATEFGIEKSRYAEFQTHNPCVSEGPFEFHIPPNPQMLQLSKNFLLVDFHIADANGERIKESTPGTGTGAAIANPKVAPIQSIAKSFIRQVVVSMNGHQAYDSGTLYAYKAFFESELSYSLSAKRTFLELGGYSAEEEADVDRESNPGFLQRSSWVQHGKSVQMMAPLHCDIFQQDKYMLSNVEITINITRNPDAFCLCYYKDGHTEKYKMVIERVRLFVRTVDVLNSVAMGVEKALLSSPARYPYRRVHMVNVPINTGRYEAPHNDIFYGEIPTRVIMGIVDHEAHIGSYKKSPFNFQPFTMKRLFLRVGGVAVPAIPFEPDFENNKFCRSYWNFCESLGIPASDTGNGVTKGKFKKGWCIYVWNLTPTEDDGNGSWNLSRRGNVSLSLEFSDAVPAGGYTAIIYGEYDSCMMVDSSRNFFFDFKP